MHRPFSALAQRSVLVLGSLTKRSSATFRAINCAWFRCKNTPSGLPIMNNELTLNRNCVLLFCLISSTLKSSSGGWVVGCLERMCAARADPREWARMCWVRCERGGLTERENTQRGEYSPLAHSSRSLDSGRTIAGKGGLLECIPFGGGQGACFFLPAQPGLRTDSISLAWH